MGSNIFGGGEDKNKEYIEKIDTHSKTLVHMIERQKDVESSLDLLNEKLELLDHNSVKNFKNSFVDIKEIRSDLKDLKEQIQSIKEFNSKIVKQIRLMSSKDEVVKLEKYIDLWNPMDFVSRAELDELREKMKKDIEEILLGFLK